jgi:hypothetical protein
MTYQLLTNEQIEKIYGSELLQRWYMTKGGKLSGLQADANTMLTALNDEFNALATDGQQSLESRAALLHLLNRQMLRVGATSDGSLNAEGKRQVQQAKDRHQLLTRCFKASKKLVGATYGAAKICSGSMVLVTGLATVACQFIWPKQSRDVIPNYGVGYTGMAVSLVGVKMMLSGMNDVCTVQPSANRTLAHGDSKLKRCVRLSLFARSGADAKGNDVVIPVVSDAKSLPQNTP